MIAFLAARKQLGSWGGHSINAHLGVEYVADIDGEPRHQWMPFAGFEFGLTPRISFIAEGRPRGNAEFGTPVALTLTYRATDRWRLAVSWANNGLSDTPKFGFGAGFALGSRRQVADRGSHA